MKRQTLDGAKVTSGLIQLHGDTLVLTLGSSGRIAARNHELREDHAAQQTWHLKP